ncbi:MAG TPA: hypothetical protein VM553_08075 [Dongiaceae bacterium]|nr:hypothetical protein [Dongiaceae bacterium]
MLSPRINQILLAEADPAARQCMEAVLRRLAPHANLQTVSGVMETYEALARNRPVLAVINFSLADGNFLQILKDLPRLPLPPFVLGLTACPECAETVYAMRYGFNHVVETAPDGGPPHEAAFVGALLQVVSEPAPLDATIGKLVNPLLFNQQEQFDLKQLSDAIEDHIFNLASHVTQSKNGLGKLLGISRQLVQYHFKKSNLNR